MLPAGVLDELERSFLHLLPLQSVVSGLLLKKEFNLRDPCEARPRWFYECLTHEDAASWSVPIFPPQ